MPCVYQLDALSYREGGECWHVRPRVRYVPATKRVSGDNNAQPPYQQLGEAPRGRTRYPARRGGHVTSGSRWYGSELPHRKNARKLPENTPYLRIPRRPEATCTAGRRRCPGDTGVLIFYIQKRRFCYYPSTHHSKAVRDLAKVCETPPTTPRPPVSVVRGAPARGPHHRRQSAACQRSSRSGATRALGAAALRDL